MIHKTLAGQHVDRETAFWGWCHSLDVVFDVCVLEGPVEHVLGVYEQTEVWPGFTNV